MIWMPLRLVMKENCRFLMTPVSEERKEEKQDRMKKHEM